MYTLEKYKQFSYLIMYTALSNMAFRQKNGINGFIFTESCRLPSDGSNECKHCKNSITISIPFGKYDLYQSLCLFCLNRLYYTRSRLDTFFTDPILRSESFKKIQRSLN